MKNEEQWKISKALQYIQGDNVGSLTPVPVVDKYVQPCSGMSNVGITWISILIKFVCTL